MSIIMNVLKKLLFTLILMVGISGAAFAQKDQDKKPPPKGEKPPVIKPGDKDRPKDKPKKPEGGEEAAASLGITNRI